MGLNTDSSLSAKSVIYFISFALLFISTTTYLPTEAQTVDEHGFIFFISMGTLTVAICNLTIVLKMEKTLTSFGKCEEFISKRFKYRPTSSVVYIELNRKSEYICELINTALVKLTHIAVIVPQICVTAVNYFIYDLKDESYYFSCPVWFPFNWKTPHGYLLAIIIQSAAAYVLIFGSSTIITFGFCPSWLFVTIVRDITNDLSHLNHTNEFDSNAWTTKLRFCKIIEFFSDVKQLMNESNRIYGIIGIVGILWTRLAICSSVLVLQIQLSEGLLEPIEIKIIISSLMVFWSFLTFLGFCVLGQMVTDAFGVFNETLCNANWYLFPSELQRMMVIFMKIAQQPTVVGYGSNIYNREAFKKTSDQGFSYYMIIRMLTR